MCGAVISPSSTWDKYDLSKFWVIFFLSPSVPGMSHYLYFLNLPTPDQRINVGKSWPRNICMASLVEYYTFVYGVNCKNINLFGVLIMTVHFDPVTFIPYVRHPPNFFLSIYTHGGGRGG